MTHLWMDWKFGNQGADKAREELYWKDKNLMFKVRKAGELLLDICAE